MLSRPITLFLVAGTIALFAGCTTVADSPGEDIYQPPPPGAPAAFLKGSSITDGGMFGSEHRGFVIMVDLKSVPDAAERWNEPIALTPGKHTVVTEYRYSNFMARAYLPLDARAGVTYQLMIKEGHDQTPEARMYNDFWIVDQGTGNPVTQIYRRQVTGGKGATIFRGNS
jgi:hypothetical protein